MMNKKGQVTILGLIMVVIMIVVFSAIYPLLKESIESVTNDSHLSSTTRIILDFLIPAVAISILITIFIFVSPQR